jgi:hypothetical protein
MKRQNEQPNGGIRVDDEVQLARGKSKRLRRIAITICCVVLGMIGGLVVFAISSVRRPPPPMTAADFTQAVDKWKANRPANYTMTIQVSGRQQGTMHSVVVDNEPVEVTRSGNPVARHTWKYWTVEGLFSIIRTDLENLDQPERAFGAKDTDHLVQQAEFDGELGYPRRYRRAVLTTGDAIEWEIVDFVIH